jgi:hypothetical protein
MLVVAGSLALAGVVFAAQHQSQRRADIDWNAVGQAIGIPGTPQSAGVYRVDIPRTDLKVTIKPVLLKPAFALGSYAVFMPMGGGTQAMVMGIWF